MIQKFEIQHLEGTALCKANGYSYDIVISIPSGFCGEFRPGITVLQGDIDDAGWCINYIISAPLTKKNEFMFNKTAEESLGGTPCAFLVDQKSYTLPELKKITFYMDTSSFHGKDARSSIYNLVQMYCRQNLVAESAEEICGLFHLDKQRVTKPICQVGNEVFRSLAAIGYAAGKEIFCFPWISKNMMHYYGKNLLYACNKLGDLGKIVLLPTNYRFNDANYNIVSIEDLTWRKQM